MEALEQSACGVSKGEIWTGSIASGTQRRPFLGVRTKKQGDGGSSDNLRWATRQTRPANFAAQAEHVQHRGLVTFEPRGQHITFPRAGRKLEAIELRENRPQTFGARQLARGPHVLPREEEPHELGWADRCNFGAQAIQGVAVDSREQTPIAPFQRTRVRCERPTQNRPFRFERQQGRVDVSLWYPTAGSKHIGRHWPGDRHPAAEDFHEGSLSSPCTGGSQDGWHD